MTTTQQIPLGWRLSTVADEATLQRGFDITRAEQRPGHVPVISSGGTASYHDTASAQGPGVILGRKGTLGTVFFSNTDYWPHDTTLWVKDFHGNDPRFVYYFFKGLDVAHLDVGSANPTLNRNHVHPMRILWPPLAEQHAIAASLGALDDKIALNRRMNETLEAIAQALFTSWFVDFDPIRAKMAGRQPEGMDAQTAALFPDRLVASAYGEIPEGWLIMPLDQIASFLNGLALQKYPPTGSDDLPVIKIAELRHGVTSGTSRASTAIDSKYVVNDGDVLFSWSGSLAICLWSNGQGALNQHLFKVTSALYPKWFYYYWINVHLPEFQAIAAGKATTMGHIQRHHLADALVLVPPVELLRSMNTVMEPLLNRYIANNREARTSTVLRDALLPKLLSGEIRVTDAERHVEAVL